MGSSTVHKANSGGELYLILWRGFQLGFRANKEGEHIFGIFVFQSFIGEIEAQVVSSSNKRFQI